MEGDCGLLFTDKSVEEALKYFAAFSSKTYARGGVVSNETIVLKAGGDTFAKFPNTMEPHLRSLGLPTHIASEKIYLERDFELAKENEELTVEKAKILKLLNYKLGEFKIKIVASWTKDGVYSKYE